jgi:hypothetical protein
MAQGDPARTTLDRDLANPMWGGQSKGIKRFHKGVQTCACS